MGRPQRKATSQRDSVEDIAAYYSTNQEETRLEVQQLEFMITSRLLKKYLSTPSKVLEIGAGTGRYTLELARAKHDVTAIELVETLSQANRNRLSQQGFNIEVRTGDARDLVREMKGPFDAALAMGPFYHLVKMNERTELMNAMVAKTRRGGLVITTHLTRLGVVAYMLARYPEWALQSPKQVDQILEGGHLWDHPRNGDFRGYFSTCEEIREMHEASGLEVVSLHSQDPCIGAVDEIFSNLPSELKARWADVLTQLSADELALGSGRSLICISKV